jgi:hypothetical protein
MVLALVLLAAGHDSQEVYWSDLEPLARERFAIQRVGTGYALNTATAPQTPTVVDDAITAAVNKVRPAVMVAVFDALQAAMPASVEHGLEAGNEVLREQLFNDNRVIGLLREEVTKALSARAIQCSDCTAPTAGDGTAGVVAPERASGKSAAPPENGTPFEQFVPYLVRFLYVAPGDLGYRGQAGFHICAAVNGLDDLTSVEPQLAQVAFAAMQRVVREDQSVVEMAARHLAAARQRVPGSESPEVRRRLNDAWWGMLSVDQEFLGKVRRYVRDEARRVGLACSNCAEE